MTSCNQSVDGVEMALRTPRIYLLLENPRKSNNLGAILRCAAAFGVAQVVAIGFEKCATEGSHGAAKHVSMIAFPSVEQAVDYLRTERGCTSFVGILGAVPGAYDCNGYNMYRDDEDLVQVDTDVVSRSGELSPLVDKRSFPVNCRPFVQGNCCFVIRKNSTGLPRSLANPCDFFCHVPCVNASEEGHLLEAPSFLSIALHHFTAWARYDERDFQGHKFEVEVRRMSDHEKEVTRSALQKDLAAEQAIDGTLAYMFGADSSRDY